MRLFELHFPTSNKPEVVMIVCDVRVYASITNAFARLIAFFPSILVARRSLQTQKKDRTNNGLDKMKSRDLWSWTASSARPSRPRHRSCSERRGRLLGIEVDTRVGHDALRINGLTGSTAIGILVEYDITFVFDELGGIAFSLILSCRWKLILTLQVRRA